MSVHTLRACMMCWLMAVSTSAKRVLFMPYPTPSRSITHVSLAQSLTTRGHDVTLVLDDRILKMGIIDSTGISVMEYHTTLDFQEVFVTDPLRQFFAGNMKEEAHEHYFYFFDDTLRNVSLYEDMKTVNADLFVFDDDISASKMFAVFAYKLGVPFACVDYAFQPVIRRIPFSPATVPSCTSSFGDRMSLLERLQNTLTFFFDTMCPLYLQDAVARYAPEKDYLPLDRLVAQAEVWLVESDPILQYPYPTLPNVKYIGGLMSSPDKPLDSLFQPFMDSACDGVIVVSFGSMVFNLPPEIISGKLLVAFQKLSPMKVVFRANVTSPDTSQILTSYWLPQNSLLAHPNCKLFVSHGGMNGHYEALYHAVPILDLPLLYDGNHNAKTIESKGFGFTLDIRKVTADDLVAAIKELVGNPRYKVTVSKASALYREVYGEPRVTAAYWLDHVMKHGGGYMRSSGQDMPLYQFLLLDVLLILLACGLALLGGVCCCLGWACRNIRGTKKKAD